jgi:hypothetical protein
MQPKRSRLFLTAALGQKAERRFEDVLFAKLAEVTGRSTADVPYTPTFFPYLLAQSQGPREMLANTIALRSSPEVRDYRRWLDDALRDFDASGRISAQRRRDVDVIAAAVRAKLASGGATIPLDVKAMVVDAARGEPQKGVREVAASATDYIWGFIVENLPGNRHRKLLLRALLADAEYLAIAKRVRSVWSGPSFG